MGTKLHRLNGYETSSFKWVRKFIV